MCVLQGQGRGGGWHAVHDMASGLGCCEGMRYSLCPGGMARDPQSTLKGGKQALAVSLCIATCGRGGSLCFTGQVGVNVHVFREQHLFQAPPPHTEGPLILLPRCLCPGGLGGGSPLSLALSPPFEVKIEASVHSRSLFHVKAPRAGLCRGTDGPFEGPHLRMVPTHQWGVGMGGGTQRL